jgi:hypothetical protein
MSTYLLRELAVITTMEELADNRIRGLVSD